ncbi:lipopolysaccharide biosynthesis protein [Clostridium perfringens]|uniref:lipopolysaccharide biosynthesis protein n=1 Tax=Clostridium perfringens TaxID=1502 RepID=UPI0018E46FB2|nr:lipopolysaccharide biosynthesis protein [Clostridium perfringens]EIF6174300.1 lipopolysaccharide biosynthesis protein [Clostridium perfringens]MBI6047916.1 lipopolysaccharide biosynthesis protein [Clostridium perfringens]MDM0806574.1 lipopolysaccharide biosynthesis protein [Clostridium perfringens]
MSNKITQKKILKSLFWKIMENGGVQLINFLITIILARILSPEDYGLMAIILIFINLSNVIIQKGFNIALIQKKEADELDFSTAFYVSIFISVIFYGILYFSSPYIARFYGQEKLIIILRVLSVNLILGAISSIQIAIITREMDFKKLFNRSILATIISGVSGIITAYLGLGVWALVIQQIVNQFVATIVMWNTMEWRPKLVFSFKRLFNILDYGWSILIANLISTIFKNIRSLVIGKIYTVDMLGFYNRGRQFPELIFTVVDSSIQSVMLPTFSSEQENRILVKNMLRRTIKISTFLIFPAMLGLAVISKPLIIILLTEKWAQCIPFFKIYCIVYMILPIHTANLQAIQSLGYSRKILKLEIIVKIIEVFILIISLNYGVYAIAMGMLISSIITLFINLYPNKNLLNYSLKEQLIDIFPALCLSISMAIIISFLDLLNVNLWLTLILQVILGVIVYIILSQIFKIESYQYLINTLKSSIKK